MSVIDRKNRARRQFALPVTEDENPIHRAFARGCVQHHDDDRWFHMGEKFNLMCAEFAVELRDWLGEGMGHQSSFLGHISIELLLDSVLCERDSTLLDRYYDLLSSLDAEQMQAAANKICRKPVTVLTMLVPRFVNERFLADYYDDKLLLYRLNGVMKRVKLPQLPDRTSEWLSSARIRVRDAADELLTPPAVVDEVTNPGA